MSFQGSLEAVLFDTDIFVILGGANLLPEIHEGLGLDLACARRLDPLPFMLKDGSLAKRLPKAAIERSLAWCEVIEPIVARPSDELLDQLSDVDEIDVGEALLMAVAAENSGALLATGDKSALETLTSTPSLEDLHRKLTGRVLCLEVAIEILVEHIGFQSAASKLTSVRTYSRTVNLLFSRGAETSLGEFQAGLLSFVSDLERRVGPDLLFRP